MPMDIPLPPTEAEGTLSPTTTNFPVKPNAMIQNANMVFSP